MSKKRIFIVGMACCVLGCATPQPNPKATPTAPDKAREDFVMTWEVEGSLLTIQTGQGVFDYQVDWDNDGTFDEQRFSGPATHTYAAPGTYTVRVRGRFPHAYLCSVDEDSTDEQSAVLLSVDQWGSQRWSSMHQLFYNCFDLQLRASDKPDLRGVTDMSGMFENAYAFNQSIDDWDTSHVTSMGGMFYKAHAFNQPLGSWDVSKVTNMGAMFYEAKAFNQPIESWDVSQVTNMEQMFQFAAAFNQPLAKWKVGAGVKVDEMFEGADAFNQDLSAWAAKP